MGIGRGLNELAKVSLRWVPMNVLVGTVILLAGCEKARLDEKVRELCAKDGGVKVHETVTMPDAEYEKYAANNWILPEKARVTANDEYYYEKDIIHLGEGKPTLTRTHYRIIRASDGKVLGESVHYSRGGGDLPGPWHGSSYICPPISKERPRLERSIFLRGIPK